MDTTSNILNPLVWIDLELTGIRIKVTLGLDQAKDHIVEIAVIITDGTLTQQILGPNLVIHYPDAILNNMSPWCTMTFTKNGLLTQIKESKVTLHKAQDQVLTFLKQHIPEHTAPLVGNSCYVDRSFIKREMPLVDQYLGEDNLDISSIAQCCKRWKPGVLLKVKKSGKHRGLDDIKDSIEELKVYKYNLFS